MNSVDTKTSNSLPDPWGDLHRTRSSVSEYAQRIGKHPATIFRQIDRLITKGSLQRKRRAEAGTTKLNRAVESKIAEEIRASKLPIHAHGAALIISENVAVRCRELNFPAPSYTTILSRVRENSASPRSVKLSQAAGPLHTYRIAFAQIAHAVNGTDGVRRRRTSGKSESYGWVAVAIHLPSYAIVGFSDICDEPTPEAWRQCIRSALLPKAPILRQLRIRHKRECVTVHPDVVQVTISPAMPRVEFATKQLDKDLRSLAIRLETIVIRKEKLHGAILEHMLPSFAGRLRNIAHDPSLVGKRKLLMQSISDAILEYNSDINGTIGWRPMAAFKQALPQRESSGRRPSENHIPRICLAEPVTGIVDTFGVKIYGRVYDASRLKYWLGSSRLI